MKRQQVNFELRTSDEAALIELAAKSRDQTAAAFAREAAIVLAREVLDAHEREL
jgi:uncharacterized protein (DUF1778 family)